MFCVDLHALSSVVLHSFSFVLGLGLGVVVVVFAKGMRRAQSPRRGDER